jgi:RNA polymerase sigma factor (sigma-70 family)
VPRHEPTDLPAEVIARALAGDEVAFRRFYRRYNPAVRWAVGMRVYRWPELVPLFEDIVQEVWLHLLRGDWAGLRYYESDRGTPFGAFVAVIAARCGWRVAKRHLGHSEDLVGMPADDDWDFVMRILSRDLLDRLVVLVGERLDEEDRLLFEGHYVHGEQLQDVGARLGMKRNTAHKRHQRLKGKLAALAEELLGEPPPRNGVRLIAGTIAVVIVFEGGLEHGDAAGSSATVAAQELEVEHA